MHLSAQRVALLLPITAFTRFKKIKGAAVNDCGHSKFACIYTETISYFDTINTKTTAIMVVLLPSPGGGGGGGRGGGGRGGGGRGGEGGGGGGGGRGGGGRGGGEYMLTFPTPALRTPTN